MDIIILHNVLLLRLSFHSHFFGSELTPLFVLFAQKLVHESCAAPALDVAAPVELAVAALVLVCLELVVPSAAAHQLAAVHTL